ncbi:hypothetical protein H5410_028468 [Solanum commersonii]|uniref:Uncharacterized protein n=1 Tax=Solanum commersonii TaxID=4109 RepID=A0A9J5Z4X2_SOLCO|nr:hypothetical protein H5410_028468 [Solanum commersonii]
MLSKDLPSEQQTRSATVMPQTPLPPPQGSSSIAGNVRGKRLRQDSMDIDLIKFLLCPQAPS